MVSDTTPSLKPRKQLVIGNWKMNGLRASNASLLAALREAGASIADVAVCVPSVYVADVAGALAGSAVAWGAQDCSSHEAGAFTGEVSAAMLADLACRYVLVGHSERRAMHDESDRLVGEKAKAALAHGVTPVVCVGETLVEREADHTARVVHRQLAAVIDSLGDAIAQVVVAYEPVWAIGTGKTASPQQAQDVHALLRSQLTAAVPAAGQMRLLYGGSVKAENAATLFAQQDIDGGLVGGASLEAAAFIAICRAAR